MFLLWLGITFGVGVAEKIFNTLDSIVKEISDNIELTV